VSSQIHFPTKEYRKKCTASHTLSRSECVLTSFIKSNDTQKAAKLWSPTSAACARNARTNFPIINEQTLDSPNHSFFRLAYVHLRTHIHKCHINKTKTIIINCTQNVVVCARPGTRATRLLCNLDIYASQCLCQCTPVPSPSDPRAIYQHRC